MKVDPRCIKPFNDWWPSYGGHCEADPKVVAAFSAGFKAGLERAVAETIAIMKGKPMPPVGKSDE